MSSHVLSRLVISCHVMSSHVFSRLVASGHVMSCHMSCHVISRLVTSCHLMSCHLTSCHVMSCHVMSCHLTSSHVLSYHVMSCHVTSSCSRILLPKLPSLLNSSIMAAGWPRRGFRNRGPSRESGSERRSRCGAACIACMSRGRRGGWWTWASFCVAGCGDRACWRCVAGMSRVCRGCVAALCRGDWVPGAFCTRMVNVRFAWQAAGIVRAGRCVAGMPRACWRRSAVGIGFRACRTRA